MLMDGNGTSPDVLEIVIIKSTIPRSSYGEKVLPGNFVTTRSSRKVELF